ncbi:MAG: hypothetical protein Pg6C_04810 [Treponemataceae bacterium]|nr:MAG: hypothetical protein Pg6C_04810 [Treponemataceae bacterium]
MDRDDAGNITYNVSKLDAFGDENLRSVLQQSIQEPGKLTHVKQGNKNYAAILAPITAGAGLELNIGIVIPDDDIIGHVRENLKFVTLFSIGILILLMILSSLFSQTIATPMRRLADEMTKIKSFDLDSTVSINTSFLEIINMRDSFESMRGGLRNFRRYVPADLVGKLIREEIRADLGGEKQELTIFFSDIANFTSITEKMEPEQLVPDLRTYFEVASRAILENHGTIDKYIGDSVMAFWGAPVRMDNHADLACRSALFIRNNLYSLFQQWAIQGKYPFYTRMGIHTGEVVVGNLGYHERLNYTVIGDAVNVASRLEGLNKVYGTNIIVSEFTWNRCRDSLEFRLLDRVSVAGREGAFEIYELLALKDVMGNFFKQLYRYYETGLRYYFDRNWDEALKYFNAVLKRRPEDTPSKVMRERCLRFKQNPPPPEWNGIFIQQSKWH